MRRNKIERQITLENIGLKESFLKFDVIKNEQEKRELEKKLNLEKKKKYNQVDFSKLNDLEFQTRKQTDQYFKAEGKNEDEIDFLNF